MLCVVYHIDSYIPIIKHMPFFKTVIFANNDGTCIYLKFYQYTYDHTVILSYINDIEWSKFKVTPMIHWFNKVLLHLKSETQKTVIIFS